MTETISCVEDTDKVQSRSILNTPPARSRSQSSCTSSISRTSKTHQIVRRKSAKSLPGDELQNESGSTSLLPSSTDQESSHDNAIDTTPPARTASQRMRARQATLASLTSDSSLTSRESALFDDSPRIFTDFPGSVHLADDEHIRRLAAKVGTVKLIRQYAHDLAKRDFEMTIVRKRAELRERELKSILKEMNVPILDIEKRLLGADAAKENHRSKQNLECQLGSALNELMDDAVVETNVPYADSSIASSIPIKHNGGLVETPRTSGLTHHEASIVRKRTQDNRSDEQPNLESLSLLNSTGSSYLIGGNHKNPVSAEAPDNASVKSDHSAKSSLSWTRIFGSTRVADSRTRALSVEQKGSSGFENFSAAQRLSRTTRLASSGMNANSQARNAGPRSSPVNRAVEGREHKRRQSDASSLPPTVEMDAVVQSSQLPPTMSNHSINDVLVDRFGFIYDRQHKRQTMLNKASVVTHSSSIRNTTKVDSMNGKPDNKILPRSVEPISPNDKASTEAWQDCLNTTAYSARRPRELLSHTPSAGAVVTVNTAEAAGTITPPRHRSSSFATTNDDLAESLTSSPSNTSHVADVTRGERTSKSINDEFNDETGIGATRALLEQLTELHDKLQAERVVKWNDFLRRVRAERSNAVGERPHNTPEADLVHGELIGIATLGRSNKTKAKYIHFKTLVLHGIPVSLRPKVWAECSGASFLRTPGYYEDLVIRSRDDASIELDIVHQIRADVKRTLRDNTFFRESDGPGAQRLEELLRAYAVHNPHTGYCQGMNLIAASLLLICATSEDCFWLLVAIIDYILPSGYFDQDLLVVRADQIVLTEYVSEILPRLASKLQELCVDLEACTFHWFLSLYTGILTGGEALYRVWDVVLCLNSSDSAPASVQTRNLATISNNDNTQAQGQPTTPTNANTPVQSMDTTKSLQDHDGTCSSFLFQLSVALLKLNEEALLALETPAQFYTYLNHNMTAHNVTIDALISAAEMLRSRIQRSDVLDRRRKAIASLQ